MLLSAVHVLSFDMEDVLLENKANDDNTNLLFDVFQVKDDADGKSEKATKAELVIF